MTVLTVGVVATIATAGAAAPAVAAAAGAGVGTGVATTAAAGTVATAATVAGSAGAGAAAGAITGAGVASAVGASGAAVAGAASTGAAVGSAAAAAVSSSSAGFCGIVGGLATGPVGWIVLGTLPTSPETTSISYDCWKQVLHDTSLEPSKGMLIRDIVKDPRIKHVTPTGHSSRKISYLSEIILENIWEERFYIDFFTLPTNEITAHAVLIN